MRRSVYDPMRSVYNTRLRSDMDSDLKETLRSIHRKYGAKGVKRLLTLVVESQKGKQSAVHPARHTRRHRVPRR